MLIRDLMVTLATETETMEDTVVVCDVKGMMESQFEIIAIETNDLGQLCIMIDWPVAAGSDDAETEDDTTIDMFE